jgi:hypothetical protein
MQFNGHDLQTAYAPSAKSSSRACAIIFDRITDTLSSPSPLNAKGSDQFLGIEIIILTWPESPDFLVKSYVVLLTVPKLYSLV